MSIALLWLLGYVTVPVILAFILLPIIIFIPHFLFCLATHKTKPALRYYKWAMIRKGPQGIASKVLLAVAIGLLCSGIMLAYMELRQGIISHPAILGTVLGLSHPAVIVGLVLGYLPQLERREEPVVT